MATSEKSRTPMIILTAALLVGASVFLYHQWRSARPVIAAPVGQEDMRGPRPGRGDFEQMRQEMADRLGLTDEQRAQMEALGPFPGPDATPEERQARREAMQQILTPEQQDIMREQREQMGQRMRERMEQDLQRLPADQQERFRRRLEERMNERGGRRGGPMGGPGGPPPSEFSLPGTLPGSGGAEQ